MEPESTVSIPIARLHEALPTHKRGAHASSAGTRISGLAENHSSGTACRHEALGKRTPALGALADAMAGRPIFTAASMARAIGRSMPTANTVIERFAEAGIVRQINIGKRNRAFEAQRHHRGLHRLRTRGRITSQRHARQQTRPSGSVQRGTVATPPASRRLPSILPQGHRSAVGDRKSGLGSRRAR